MFKLHLSFQICLTLSVLGEVHFMDNRQIGLIMLLTDFLYW